ncbi:hypothetical protein [Aquabacter sediminis]|uniref:hypothetical protein n=1 Tax=Aquabacter sediminis TaxID=3029197 RepID=UPI00237E5DE7|nr:hypothetical protein [Aquabacter sp. P-9]MDE1567859.1 hypothetical protein [Aquabacter sp. P-9]
MASFAAGLWVAFFYLVPPDWRGNPKPAPERRSDTAESGKPMGNPPDRQQGDPRPSSAPTPPPQVVPKRQDTPAPPVEDLQQGFYVDSNWASIELKPDPLRPNVSLAADAPFRLRVNGELYTINSARPIAVDLSRASLIEVRAITASLRLTVVRSASRGGR